MSLLAPAAVQPEGVTLIEALPAGSWFDPDGSTGRLADELETLTRDTAGPVVLDLRAVPVLGAALKGLLLRMHKRCEREGRAFALCAAESGLLSLRISRLESYLNAFATPEAALAAVLAPTRTAPAPRAGEGGVEGAVGPAPAATPPRPSGPLPPGGGGLGRGGGMTPGSAGASLAPSPRAAEGGVGGAARPDARSSPRPLLVAAALLALLVAPARAANSGSDLNKKDDAWLADPANRAILDNLLTYQTPSGGWAKGYDAAKPRDPAKGRSGYGTWEGSPTIDNGGTFSEVRLCARMFALTDRPEFREAALRGLDFLLDAQYPSGGWPQCPERYAHEQGSYRQLVTFNDNAMVGVMLLLRDAAEGTAPLGFVDPERRERCRAAFDRGIDYILRSQIRANGRLTGWCQQHDPVTYAPAQGRAYEPPAIAAAESGKIVLMLIEIERPDARVRAAIAAAAAWFEATRITGKRLGTTAGPIPPGGNKKTLVDDPAAPPLWARMYDIATNRPIFVDRDGAARATITELSAERAGGYQWFGSSWGNDVAKRYARWTKRLAEDGR